MTTHKQSSPHLLGNNTNQIKVNQDEMIIQEITNKE